MSLKVIAITEIDIAPDRQREFFPESEANELRESILTGEHGLMTPILVRPMKDDRYMLVAGERRLRAITGITEPYKFGEETIPAGHIPAVVKYFSSDVSMQEAELHENVVRLQLSWQEKANAVARLHKLKLAQNPKHSIGMTAELIETTEHEGDYPLDASYKQVHQSILVSQYLGNAEVAKARDLTQASKVVSRILEEEQLKKLQELASKRAEIAKQRAIEDAAKPAAPATATLADFDLDIPAPVIVKTENKLGILHEGDMRVHLPQIPDNSINVVITDPPYGVGVENFKDGGTGTQKHEYSEADYVELHELLVKELDRICTKDAHVYIFCSAGYFYEIKKMFSEEWWVRPKALIWSKGSTGKLSDGTLTGYRSTYESILFARRGNRPCSKVTSDVLTVADERQKTHAAQKPVALYKELLGMSAIPGDTIFDPFAGSGTIFRAARGLLMNPVGIEQNWKFVELCKLAQADKDPTYSIDLPSGESEDV